VPRIQADSVAEHVAQQRAAVFDAAVTLFVEEGYGEVSMGDIAARVGLARNSLYRYFPDKAHILLEWFRDELPRQAARSAALLSGPGDPDERIGRWALDQLDYAHHREHALMASLPDLLAGADADTRAELAEVHRTMATPLDSALAEAGVADPGDRRVVADLLGGLVLAAGRSEVDGADPVVRRHLLEAMRAVVTQAACR
jgi:AcrR family transcriptional regulator